MISRNLFFKMMKEDLKRRLWSLALITLILFLFMSIRCALQIQEYTWEEDYIIDFIGLSDGSIGVLTILFAFVSGLSGFFYLQSRKKVDLYHSIPVRRESIFSVSYINGLLIYVVPYIINILVCFAIISVNGYMSGEIINAALVTFGVNILFYCLIYTVTIIAVMMTGNTIVSILGAVVIVLYGPILLELKEQYFGAFFKTYYTSVDSNEIYRFLSPLFAYVDIIDSYVNNAKHSLSITLILWSCVELIIFIALAVILYRKRPSEAAGKAMTFHKSKLVIKFLLVIPLALLGGIILRSSVSNYSDGWFLFGLLFVLFLAYAIIQIIYDFDIRSAFKHKKQLVACFIITVAVAAIFRFDVFRVDSYIPDKNNIKYMSVYIFGVDQQLASLNYSENDEQYMNIWDYQLQNMELTNFDAAYELAKLGAQSIDNLDQLNSDYGGYYYNLNSDDQFNYIVKFTLKNGTKIYRKYLINTKDCRDLIKDIYENEEYKKTHYFINQIDSENVYEIDISYASEILNYTKESSYDNENITISNKTNSQDIQELMDTYREELNQITYEDTTSGNPVATLRITSENKELRGYYVYPSFIKTIALLQKYGFDTEKTINKEDILQVDVSNNTWYYSDLGTDEYPVSDEGNMVSYSDPVKIAQLLPSLVSDEYYADNQTIYDIDDYISVTILYDIGDGSKTQSFYFYFKEGQIPDFVKRDLKLSE